MIQAKGMTCPTMLENIEMESLPANTTLAEIKIYTSQDRRANKENCSKHTI